MAEEERALTIEGLLETSLYARDLRLTAAFYRDLFRLKTLVDSPRLVALEIASGSLNAAWTSPANTAGRAAERASICATLTAPWWSWRRPASGGEAGGPREKPEDTGLRAPRRPSARSCLLA